MPFQGNLAGRGDSMSSHPIVLYNNSIFMLSIEAVLRQNSALEIVRDGAQMAPAQLLALQPALIIFDRLATAPETLLPLLLALPCLVLLGVDADSSQVLVLSGERSTVKDWQDLAHLIQAQRALPGVVA